MSFSQECADIVLKYGTKSLDEVACHFPLKTRDQIMKALQNAASQGLIHCTGNLPRPKGRGKGAAVYAPGAKPRKVTPQQADPVIFRVSSVWELANG